jgi:hypothetical protein
VRFTLNLVKGGLVALSFEAKPPATLVIRRGGKGSVAGLTSGPDIMSRQEKN